MHHAPCSKPSSTLNYPLSLPTFPLSYQSVPDTITTTTTTTNHRPAIQTLSHRNRYRYRNRNRIQPQPTRDSRIHHSPPLAPCPLLHASPPSHLLTFLLSHLSGTKNSRAQLGFPNPPLSTINSHTFSLSYFHTVIPSYFHTFLPSYQKRMKHSRAQRGFPPLRCFAALRESNSLPTQTSITFLGLRSLGEVGGEVGHKPHSPTAPPDDELFPPASLRTHKDC